MSNRESRIRSATRHWGARYKIGLTGRKAQYWVIHPEADAEIAAAMDEVPGTYQRP